MLHNCLKMNLTFAGIGSCSVKPLFMASSLPRCVYLVYSTMLPIGRTLSPVLL